MGETTAISWCDHKACSACGQDKPLEAFHADRSHPDGRASVCRNCKNGAARARYQPKGPPERYGPAPAPGRDGDKLQARHRVNRAVDAGDLPDPNSLACADCGHLGNNRRHEYDHHQGYEAAHHLDVQAVCTRCHHRRDNPRARQTHCKRGHAFTPENTGLKANGTRFFRECRQIINNNQTRGRDAAYWRAYRAERKARHG